MRRVLGVWLAVVGCAGDSGTSITSATDTDGGTGPTDVPPTNTDPTDPPTEPPTDTQDTGGPPITTVGSHAVWINEFMASNTLTLQDESGAFPDWVELYNPGSAEIDLSGWHFSDDAAVPDKWTFAVGSRIAAGGFLVLYADADIDQGPKHTSFQLEAKGEDLVLTDAGGGFVDQVLGYGPQVADVSLARMPDGGVDWNPDNTSTPGLSNN